MRFIYTKGFLIFFATLSAVFFLLLLQAKGWLGPVRQVFVQAPRPVAYLVGKTAGSVKGFLAAVYQLRGIAAENATLRGQVVELQRQLTDYDQEKRDNEALRKQLGFADSVKYSLVACSAIAENPFGLTDTLVLNCGGKQGVAVGQAVVSEGYLVGKIIYVDKYSSTALLAISSKFSVDAQISKTGSYAIAEGSFGAGMVLDRLPQTQDLQAGWLVTTAGINEQVPKGILLGQIGDVISSQNDLFKKTTLLSPIDFSSLGFVFVARP
ncbi:MAG: rod shape-determining protein MreC [Patescibacteria group bacterium]|nr:rod shape-determining protein MreC [Patescibacteria group bacterium]